MTKKLFIFLGLALFIAGFASAQVREGGTLYVAIRTVTLKSGTGLFTSDTGTLEYGDRVTVVQVRGNHVEVRSDTNPPVSGWTASANLTAKQVSSGNTATVSTRDTAMAGKGFNREVEDSYRTQGNLNYADVDRVEAIVVNMADLERFLREGRLSMGE